MTMTMTASPLLRTATDFPTDYWNDSCNEAELRYAMENGAVGATTNPTIVGSVMQQEFSIWAPRVREIVAEHPAWTDQEVTWQVIEEMAIRGWKMLEPIYQQHRGQKGRLSIQIDPTLNRSADRMLAQARHFHTLAPNVQIKFPATAAGLEAIEQATYEGMTINATVSFTVSQALAVGEAVQRALARREAEGHDTSWMSPTCTIMIGRTDDWVKKSCERDGIIIDPAAGDWAGIAVFKRAAAIFGERGYRARLLAAAYRHHLHWSELIGGDISMTYLTTQRKVGSRVVFVVDSEETEQCKSHIGDELFAVDDEMREVLAGLKADRNALYADEFGVWITASAPLRDGRGNIVGLVAADCPARPSLAHDGGDAVRTSMASLLGEVTKRIVRAEFEATIDGLTGIYNHRYLHEHLTGEVSKAIAQQSEFVVLFVDIDYFKAFNDRWGHSLGDEVLRAVAHIIEGQIRRGDIVARYGGEEFVAVLSDCDLSSGMLVADRIRMQVARSPLVVGTGPVTVSIGVALFPAHAASRAELIERADTAMYEAKRLGRNRVQACV